MTLKEALETLADFYGIETDGKTVHGHATHFPTTPHEVWLAWEIVLRKIGRIKP